MDVGLELENVMFKQLGFISALPSDIVAEIVSHLSQQDFLTCMSVCRNWYSIVPQYAQDVWKKLQLSDQDASINHKRRKQCLGSHVKSVTIGPAGNTKRVKEKTLYAIMMKLLDWGCTEIVSFGITSCYIADQREYTRLLEGLAPRLTHLNLTKPPSKFDIMSFIITFPELTHFSCRYAYSFGTMTRDSSTTARQAAMPIDFRTKLQHLWLDVDNLDKSEKQDLLKRSPDLRCFIDDNDDVSSYLDSLVSWCPKLVCVEGISYCRFEENREDHDIYTKKSLDGLRYISLYNRSYPDRIAPQLVKSQNTLEYLSLWNDNRDYDWTRTFGLFQFPNLHTLITVHNHFTVESLIDMLNLCPNLETLKLYPRRDGLTLNSDALLRLQKMHKIRYLNCDDVALSRDLSLLTFLEWFPALEILCIPKLQISPVLPERFECPRQLKHLILPEIVWKHHDDCDKDAEIARFLECLTCQSKLEIIRLREVSTIGPKSLLMLATIPTLKYLDVQLDRTVREEDLLEFIKTLGGTTVIECLTLRYLPSLSLPVFDALAELPTLTKFSAERAISSYSLTSVSKDGLLHILRTSPTLTSITFNVDFEVKDEQGQKLEALRIAKLVKQLSPHGNIPGTESKCWNIWGFLFNDQIMQRNINIQLVGSK